jgi:hypothetical protein
LCEYLEVPRPGERRAYGNQLCWLTDVLWSYIEADDVPWAELDEYRTFWLERDVDWDGSLLGELLGQDA